jgi:hypothetical protein
MLYMIPSEIPVLSYEGTRDRNMLPHGKGVAKCKLHTRIGLFEHGSFVCGIESSTKHEYTGEFQDSQYEGRGWLKRYHASTRLALVFRGTFTSGQYMDGQAKLLYPDGSTEFKGEMKNGKPWDGQAKYLHLDGSVEYEGAIKEGKRLNKALQINEVVPNTVNLSAYI